jgi:hypothetical protein
VRGPATLKNDHPGNQKRTVMCSGWKARATKSPPGDRVGKIRARARARARKTQKHHPPKNRTSYSYSVRPGGRYSYSYSKNATNNCPSWLRGFAASREPTRPMTAHTRTRTQSALADGTRTRTRKQTTAHPILPSPPGGAGSGVRGPWHPCHRE